MLRISHTVTPPDFVYDLDFPEEESESEKWKRLNYISYLAKFCQVVEPEPELNYPEHNWYSK